MPQLHMVDSNEVWRQFSLLSLCGVLIVRQTRAYKRTAGSAVDECRDVQ